MEVSSWMNFLRADFGPFQPFCASYWQIRGAHVMFLYKRKHSYVKIATRMKSGNIQDQVFFTLTLLNSKKEVVFQLREVTGPIAFTVPTKVVTDYGPVLAYKISIVRERTTRPLL